MSSRPFVLAIAALSLIAGPASAGGRARVTVLHAPPHVVAGQSFEITFAVQPEWPMARDRALAPTVKAVCGDRIVTLDATPLRARGQYRAALTLPQAGEWRVTVDSRFCETRMDALVLRAEDKAPGQS